MDQRHKTYSVLVLRDFRNFKTTREIIFVSITPPSKDDLCLAQNEEVLSIIEKNNCTVIVEKRGKNGTDSEGSGKSKDCAP